VSTKFNRQVCLTIVEKDTKVLVAAILVGENQLFSVSQLNCYKKCPRRYQYRYLKKIPQKPQHYFNFGSTIHDTVEQLTRMAKDGKPIDQNVANGLLSKFWEPKSYRTRVDEERDFKEAKAILKVFLEEQAKSKSEVVDIERWFETSIGDVRVTGRIDRIDKEDGDFTVIDYKTSKKASSIDELKKDMQLLIYYAAVSELYGGKPTVGDWFLRTNQKVFFKPEDQAIDALKTELADTAGKIKAASFAPTPGWECNYCDYNILCELSH
jgi:putative RecB family exonuclease